jgi:hypothetical protein
MADALVTKSRMENQKHRLIKRVISRVLMTPYAGHNDSKYAKMQSNDWIEM